MEKEIDIGPIRPPSEGGSSSLLIRTTRNCPWNRCSFCYGLAYNHEKFQLRSIEEIIKDIDRVIYIKKIIDEILSELGEDIQSPEQIVKIILKKHSELLSCQQTFLSVFNWIASGAKTVFLQDADSLVMKTDKLVEVLCYLTKSFPTIQRVTTYARAKTVLKKSASELKMLNKAGLLRLHVGLETGDDDLLKQIKKGITAIEHIESGRKAIDAGFELSTYVMPGLGGLDMSMNHAKNTAYVLNKINPHYIRSRPFVPRPGTPIFEDYQAGKIRLLLPHSILREMGVFISSLTASSQICFDHMINPSYRSQNSIVHLFSQDYEGYCLQDKKEELLAIISNGLEIEESKFISYKNYMNGML